jgi:hypothetical protein
MLKSSIDLTHKQNTSVESEGLNTSLVGLCEVSLGVDLGGQFSGTEYGRECMDLHL